MELFVAYLGNSGGPFSCLKGPAWEVVDICDWEFSFSIDHRLAAQRRTRTPCTLNHVESLPTYWWEGMFLTPAGVSCE